MLSFRKYIHLSEHVLSIGLNAEHEKYRETHRHQIHNLIRNSYKKIGGYSGHASGSDEESKAIHADISSSVIKAVRRPGNKITAVNLYKKSHGRKSLASATDGTDQGKSDFIKTKFEDTKMRRAWGEVSGAVEHIHNKLGTDKIPFSRAKKLVNKPDMEPDEDGVHYTRRIGATKHKKIAVGYPKDD